MRLQPLAPLETAPGQACRRAPPYGRCRRSSATPERRAGVALSR